MDSALGCTAIMPRNRHERRRLASSAGSAAAFTVDEWCARYKFGRSFFYKLLRDGRGPRIMKLGNRTLITVESDDEWRLANDGRAT
jgi:hypothetical protein